MPFSYSLMFNYVLLFPTKTIYLLNDGCSYAARSSVYSISQWWVWVVACWDRRYRQTAKKTWHGHPHQRYYYWRDKEFFFFFFFSNLLRLRWYPLRALNREDTIYLFTYWIDATEPRPRTYEVIFLWPNHSIQQLFAYKEQGMRRHICCSVHVPVPDWGLCYQRQLHGQKSNGCGNTP